jgi:hypothetical protein
LVLLKLINLQIINPRINEKEMIVISSKCQNLPTKKVNKVSRGDINLGLITHGRSALAVDPKILL